MKTAACGPVNPQPPARDVHTIGIRGPAIRNKTCIPCTKSAIAQNTQSQKRGSFAETAAELAGMFNIAHNYNYTQCEENDEYHQLKFIVSICPKRRKEGKTLTSKVN